MLVFSTHQIVSFSLNSLRNMKLKILYIEKFSMYKMLMVLFDAFFWVVISNETGLFSVIILTTSSNQAITFYRKTFTYLEY